MQRRDFLKVALGASAAAACGGFAPTIAPAKLTLKKISDEQKTFPTIYYGDTYLDYLTALNKNWKKWEKVFSRGNALKKQLGNHAKEVAMLSENLRVWNETLPDEWFAQQWKRISVPICWRSQMQSVSRELFGYQIMMAPSQLAFCSSVDEDNWKGQDTVPPSKKWGVCGYTLGWGSPPQHKIIYGLPSAAFTKKMRCTWNCEAVQDLKSVHGLDAEAELTAIIALELALEQDREHITNVHKECQTIYKFDLRRPLRRLDAFLEWAITEERKKFFDRGTRTHDHEPNEWIVTSPDVIARLESEEAITKDLAFYNSSLGLQLVGWLRNHQARVRVYQDPLFPAKEILIGRKYSDIDTGYVILPYLCYARTPHILDPQSFCPRHGILTRYSRILTNPNFYAKVLT